MKIDTVGLIGKIVDVKFNEDDVICGRLLHIASSRHGRKSGVGNVFIENHDGDTVLIRGDCVQTIGERGLDDA